MKKVIAFVDVSENDIDSFIKNRNLLVYENKINIFSENDWLFVQDINKVDFVCNLILKVNQNWQVPLFLRPFTKYIFGSMSVNHFSNKNIFNYLYYKKITRSNESHLH
jgi:hypothetical protein